MSIRTKNKNQNNIFIDTELDIISNKLGIEKQDIDFNNFDNIELVFEGLFTEIGKGLDTIVKGIKQILKAIWDFIVNLFKPKSKIIIKRAKSNINNLSNNINITNTIQNISNHKDQSISITTLKTLEKKLKIMANGLANIGIITYILDQDNCYKKEIEIKLDNFKNDYISSIEKLFNKIINVFNKDTNIKDIKITYSRLDSLDRVASKTVLSNNLKNNINNDGLKIGISDIIEKSLLDFLEKDSGLKKLLDLLEKNANMAEKIKEVADRLVANLDKNIDQNKKDDIELNTFLLKTKADILNHLLNVLQAYSDFIDTLKGRNVIVNESINNNLILEMFCNYDNNVYQELATESFGEKISLVYKNIIELIQKIYSYIKNWHPIKRRLINQQLELLKQLDYNTYDNNVFKKFNQGLNLTFSGLMYLCDYNLSNLSLLESAMFDIYYKLGSNPNPETLKDNIFIKFKINQKLNNFINFKAKEFCKDHNIIYSRHNLATVYAKANIIYLYTMVYDTDNEMKLAKFKYEVKDDMKEEIDFKKLNNKKLATDLLYSHLDSLNKFRWVTESLNKKLKDNINKYEPGVITELSKSILEMVNCLNPKFYLIAMEYSKSITKNIK